MALAAFPQSPLTKLVLNDVGPVVSEASVSRIGSYVGKWPPLPTIEAAEAYVRAVSAPSREMVVIARGRRRKRRTSAHP